MIKSKNNWRTIEGLFFILIISIVILLGKWAYIFLPKEYAEQAQIPTLEVVLTVCVAFCMVEIWRLRKTIKTIEEKMTESKNDNLQ